MAEAHIQTEQTPAQTPLLDPEQTQEEVEKDTQLDQALQRLETVLCFLGFHQSSLLSILFSWFIFLLVGVSIPVVALQISRCSDCERYQINKFELHILVSEACLAAVSLLCVSHNLRKYGIRKFLFVDRYHGHMSRFRKEYIRKIEVSSIVQVVGIVLCLHAAAKISHRAQGIASVASRWHALLTCSSTDASQLRVSNSMGNLEASNQVGSISINYSESDLESVDYLPFSTNSQLASYMSTYHKRQAFVLYLQSNPGGVTIFGWTVDRALINTIFFIELSLVLFVLGKTIVFTTK